jgi:methylated-DNA-protein-cysteine methyltransferase-like protein
MKAAVLKWVAQIPFGKVATYGQIAALSGHPRAARQVGRILASNGGDLPWQRVLNAKGKISTEQQSGELQIRLLEAEGIVFNAEGVCDLRVYLWKPVLARDRLTETDCQI